MLIRRASDVRSSDITDERVYLRRREFIRLAGGLAVTGAVGSLVGACSETPAAAVGTTAVDSRRSRTSSRKSSARTNR